MEVLANRVPAREAFGDGYGVAQTDSMASPPVKASRQIFQEILIGWRSLFDALPESRRSRFDIVMVSNPTSLDGSDEMVLIRERPSPGKPLPKPADGYIEAMTSSPR